MFGMGFMEIFLVLIVAIMALGPEKLPTALVDMAKFFKKIKGEINEAKTTLNRKKYSLSEKGRLTNINKSHRQGQRNVVQTIHIAVGEVEERLMRALARKDATQAMLLESLK